MFFLLRFDYPLPVSCPLLGTVGPTIKLWILDQEIKQDLNTEYLSPKTFLREKRVI